MGQKSSESQMWLKALEVNLEDQPLEELRFPTVLDLVLEPRYDPPGHPGIPMELQMVGLVGDPVHLALELPALGLVLSLQVVIELVETTPREHLESQIEDRTSHLDGAPKGLP